MASNIILYLYKMTVNSFILTFHNFYDKPGGCVQAIVDYENGRKSPFHVAGVEHKLLTLF